MALNKYELALYGFMEMVMINVAESMIAYMESSDVIPIDTHNLKDGIGLAVYQNGVLTRFYLNPKAKVPRTNIGLPPVPDGDVWGKDMVRHSMDYIQAALDDGLTKYSKGYTLVLYSTMPYDEIVDSKGNHAGFFTRELTSEFDSIVNEVMRKYGNKI